MVGAGRLIQLLFGLDYNLAVVCVGLLMMVYVTFGGMVANLGCRLKAGLLLYGGTALMIMAFSKFGFSFDTMFTQLVAAQIGQASPLWGWQWQIQFLPYHYHSLFSVLAPLHIMMRFFCRTECEEAS